MAQTRLGLTRQELATFLKTPEQIRQFEQLFSQTQSTGTTTEQVLVLLGQLESDIGVINGEIDSINSQIDTINTRINKYVGQFYDTTTQTAAAANTAYAMTLNTTDISDGVFLGSPSSRVYVSNAGIYNIQFSAQFDNTSGGSNHLVYVWLRVNGSDVPQTASQIRLKGTDGELVAAWNFFYPFTPNDYFELMWSVADIAVQITAQAAAATVPAIPSVIVTCFNVGE